MRRKNILNNLKIRTKLILIYFFCLLLPLFVTDAIIFTSFKDNAEKEQLLSLENVIERVEYNITETVDASVDYTSRFYRDAPLNYFLTQDYKNYSQYYDASINFVDTVNGNIGYGSPSKISFYADNETIINGGYFTKISSIIESNWYKAFQESGKKIFLYTYYDGSRKYTQGGGTSRIISIIRRLDNFDKNGIERIAKIDLDYNFILRDVLNEDINGRIYIRNKDYILFSNGEFDNDTRQYKVATSVESGQPTIAKTFRTTTLEWEILIYANDVPFWTQMYESKELLFYTVVLILLLPTVIIYFIGKSISSRLTLIDIYLNKVKKEQYEIIELKEGEDEIGNLIRSYNLMIVRIKDLIEVVFKRNSEKQTLELAKKQAELKAIQSQVNPHFLFNTLECIRMRSLIKNENETADIIGELSILFRKSMIWGSDFITIEEEIDFAEKYIKIQKYRFADKIIFYHYIMEECKQIIIPKLSIVTFIENACIHGIEGITEKGVLSVTVTKDTQNLYIEISDTGSGIAPNKLDDLKRMFAHADIELLSSSKSTGMLNSFIRLKMYCEGDMKLDIDSEINKGTDIMIQLPLHKINNVLSKKIEEIKEDASND